MNLALISDPSGSAHIENGQVREARQASAVGCKPVSGGGERGLLKCWEQEAAQPF